MAPPAKKSIFSKSFRSERMWMYKYTAVTLLVIGVALFAIMPFYWGSFYRRETRLRNLKVAIYNEDQSLIGNTLLSSLPTTNSVGWTIMSPSNRTLDEVKHEIYEEQAWTAILIEKGATDAVRNAMAAGDTNFSASSLIKVVYERERDLVTFPLIQAQLLLLQNNFDAKVGSDVIAPIASDLTHQKPLAISFQFQYIDLSAYEAQILTAVLQIGLLLLIIIAFLQVGVFAGLHMRIAKQLTFTSVITYRIVLSLVSYLFISLFICLVSLAFKVDTSVTFGKGGFVVFWMITYITMLAAGLATENVGMLAAATYPPLLGFWLFFWVILNITPTFSAMELCPPFFRYGYAVPLYNALQANRVVLVGTTKKHLGLNIGILFVWVVINFTVMPFCVRFFQSRMMKQALAAKAAATKNEQVEEIVIEQPGDKDSDMV